MPIKRLANNEILNNIRNTNTNPKNADNTNLTLIVSKGIRPDYYRIPDLINLSLNSAL